MGPVAALDRNRQRFTIGHRPTLPDDITNLIMLRLNGQRSTAGHRPTLPDDITNLIMLQSLDATVRLGATSRSNYRLAKIACSTKLPKILFNMGRDSSVQNTLGNLIEIYNAGPPTYLANLNLDPTLNLGVLGEKVKQYKDDIIQYSFLANFPKGLADEDLTGRIQFYLDSCTDWTNEKRIPFYIFCLSLNRLADRFVCKLSELFRHSSSSELTAYITNAGGIPPLVELLTVGSEQAKLQAVKALRNLSCNYDARVVIVKAGGIPPLVDLLKSGSEQEKLQAAAVLRNLACEDDARVVIVKAGGIPPLVKLLTDGSEQERLQAAAALSNLACDEGASIGIKAVGILPLVKLLTDGSEQEKLHAADALVSLTFYDDAAAIVEIVKAGGIPPLVDLLKSGSEKAKLQAVKALRNLAYNADNCVVIIKSGGIPPLVELLTSKSEKAQNEEEVDCTLQNLAIDIIKSVFENTIILYEINKEFAVPTLIALIRSGSEKVKEVAVKALRDLIWEDEDTVYENEMIEKGGIPLFIDLLLTGSEKVLDNIYDVFVWCFSENDDGTVKSEYLEEMIVPIIELLITTGEPINREVVVLLIDLITPLGRTDLRDESCLTFSKWHPNCSLENHAPKIDDGRIQDLFSLLIDPETSEFTRECSAMAFRYLSSNNKNLESIIGKDGILEVPSLLMNPVYRN